MSGSRWSGVFGVLAIGTFVGLALYPIAIQPLSSRSLKETREGGDPGFQKKGMWKAIDEYRK
ncbi:hypothetical protein CHLRE_03g155500v5 [Chlamydomonas reinhardtii]|uniref:Uncharacterized protein n=1 Tax=Chlamydomonas reinhardtii TaxID=3055 RepID=A0A2K3DW06_CHLRE|nr:uncharacterized protein CHLRE_03g155500v5 [Chlamydomonas reinhardtii]PNW84706.1 hypothetical protein CHLRE_03g155500v5 [Chlamydomonas reinhardtii]